MKSVIIADDEIWVCELLKNIINWEELGLKLIDVVYDGDSLLTSVVNKKPDIVITDINMPGMNGLEFLKELQRRNVVCRVIIISGYTQFEYAHTAIKYDVDDYVLKPINNKSINRALEKSINIIDEVSKNSNLKVESNHMLRESIFNKNINGEENRNYESLENIFPHKHYMLLCYKFDYVDSRSKNFKSIEMKIDNLLKEKFEFENIKYIDNAVEGEKIYLINTDLDTTSIREIIKSMHNKSLQYSNLYSGMYITTVLSRSTNKFDEIYSILFPEIKYLLSLRVDNGVNWFYSFDDFRDEKFSASTTNSIMKNFYYSVIDLDKLKFEAIITEMFSQGLSANNIYYLLEKMVDKFTEIYCEYLDGMKAMLEIRKIITNAYTFELLRYDVLEFFYSLFKHVELEKNNDMSPLVNKCICLIEERYTTEISLKSIAELLGVTANHLSQSFSKEMGLSFTEYLNNYRIEIAKFLLKDLEYNISEVANKIGFNDTRYFSRVFKNKVGITPTEYRKLYV